MRLPDILAQVDVRDRTLTVYAPTFPDPLSDHFASGNTRVCHSPLPDDGSGGFLVVRGEGTFRGATSLRAVDGLASPPAPGPWDDALDETPYRNLVELLDGTTFVGFDRWQMLATSRQVERRAWRAGRGTVRLSVQTAAAARDQRGVLERMAGERDLDVHLYHPPWDDAVDVDVVVHPPADRELSPYWVVAFDGGDAPATACALVGAERPAGGFHGFWTFDVELVDAVSARLRDLGG